jgi:lipoprotein-anchoring transpeptidase ErfK/SrfK
MRRSSLVHATLAAVATATTFAVAAPSAHAGTSASYPAAGFLRTATVAARAAPDPKARVVLRLRDLRPDFRRQVVLATTERVGKDGRTWVRLDLPMRPNGTVGWIPASRASLSPTRNKIVVRRSTRRLYIYDSGKLVYRTVVAVGAPGAETPLGRFYVQARFVPTDWPGGGVVGLHGTSMPQLLGQAVSHGCVRLSNTAALMLKRYAILGTPITIRP